MTTCHALWLHSKERAVLEREAIAKATGDNVTVKSRFGAISRGTEALVASGRVPRSEFERMRAPFQEGNFPFPVKYGYAVVGEVVEGPAARIGETVFCLHPHQDRFTVPGAMAAPVADAISPGRAVLAANMETAVNIVWDGAVAPGDRVAIVGGGLVGLLVAYLCAQIPGTETSVVDIDPARASIAGLLGCHFAPPDEAPTQCDVVIHTSASQEGLETALMAAGFEARLVEASWYGSDTPQVPLGGPFHSRRLTLVASQVGRVPSNRRARWTCQRRLQLALSLLGDDRLDHLITGQTRFSDLPPTYHAILEDPGTLCHRILYD